MFSTFNAYISVGTSGITNTSFYTTGTTIGWSWSQIGSFNSGWNGCAAGIVTFGLQIGDLTIGTSREYHYTYTLDAANCMLSAQWGPGPCTS